MTMADQQASDIRTDLLCILLPAEYAVCVGHQLPGSTSNLLEKN